MRTLRRDALEKIAALSAASPALGKQTDVARLCRRCPGPRSRATDPSTPKTGVTRVPMSLPEMEALLALCKAAPRASSIEIAAQLLAQLTSYLPESHIQNLSLPAAALDCSPSPWEHLTYSLASAVLLLGLKHPSLRQHAASTINRYIGSWTDQARYHAAMQFESKGDLEEADTVSMLKLPMLAVSLLGFLNASAEHASFWSPYERLRLVRTLRDSLSERYMIVLETAMSMTRNAKHPQGELRQWKNYTRRYAASGKPLGTMLLRLAFMRLVVVCTSLQVVHDGGLEGRDILDVLFDDEPYRAADPFGPEVPLDRLAEIAAEELKQLDDGSDFLQLGSSWQQRLASALKANVFKCLLCCSLIDEEIADPEALLSRLETTMSDPVQIADEYLAAVIFKSLAILSKKSASIATNAHRLLPRVIVKGGLDSRTAAVAAQCLASVLKRLPQDATITTLYSLGNVLSATGGGATDRALAASPYVDGAAKAHRSAIYSDLDGGASVLSLRPNDAEEPSLVHLITIEAIVCIAWSCKQEKIIALALSMLVQKIARLSLEVDAKIITETAILATHSAPNDLRPLLRLYSKLCHDGLIHGNSAILEAVMRARMHLSHGIKRGSDLFEIYILHLLDSIVSQGDVHENQNAHVGDVELAAQEIAQLLPPLAEFVVSNASPNTQEDLEIEGLVNLQRDAWFNSVVHGFTLASSYGKRYRKQLQILALYSQPLIAHDRADQLESDIELNTTLRRGKSNDHANIYKKHLIEMLPDCELDIKSLNYAEVVFLTSAYMVETLRASGGECSKVLTYFLDPTLRSGAIGNCMVEVAVSTVRTYLAKTLAGENHAFSAPYVSQQLALFFAGCCHRISKVQEVAIECADLIISQVPSALCHKSSLFALLELLSLMWTSCLEQETDEFEWRSTFTSNLGNISIELSDNYGHRRQTLVELHKWAKIWVLKVLDVAPLDIKGLIQTYLAEYIDEDAYGHVSLGRSFALEMGSVIPSTDQRLGAIEGQPGLHINTASDFIAQYTTRQEYRFVDGIRDDDQEWVRFGKEDSLMRQKSRIDKSIEDAKVLLADMEARTLNNKHVSIAELRDVLRRAGALLCRTDTDQGAIVHHLVGIPFAVLSKQAIKLGISLWMGVIKENARMESRILVEIAENWENTVKHRRGLFDPSLEQSDPFHAKQEFAPSDRHWILKKQHKTYHLIAPHLRLAQFLSSHFNATRLGTPHVLRIYQRLMTLTMEGLRYTSCNPLAREAHFHIILLALKILRFSTNLDPASRWRMKDRVLSAALMWFSCPPRWSFGGNRLQMKAETHLLADIQIALEKVNQIGFNDTGTRRFLQPKQYLLSMLLAHEQTRLMVWLFPLDYEKKHHFTSSHYSHTPSDLALSTALKTAWTESPALAVQLAHRFPSESLRENLRFYMLSFPDKFLDHPEAVEIMLGSSMPTDIKNQLQYLLFWAPVNPITAVNYFLPAFRNDPFIIQYAMRAMESHSVNTTFFFVPQIVQTLRHDFLGYVERYIIETAKFSQLFAHQIIWNMKANAYKDEEAQDPDSMKPTLDKVMGSLVSSFSEEDREFYEREFAFFNEVTGISGKLKPYIKKSKPEKKQKIEEELRKIKVEVGVYLPSNPDGVVVGIDRNSGKPLQSHAKAPFMATFRIRREKRDEDDEKLIETGGKSEPREATYEVWQSAIFKVGDDCRQDLLALQMIAACRSIFHTVGLDVYVNPYRVTATAPGCGVIDVLPNSISRDMLGREAVNGLKDYFVTKYGGEDSIRFQEARNNFVKSMAPYSVISYLLQIKDRHNGNIMIDDAGHVLHIDFGFCFDIVPGGVKFERAPFKLTYEMVSVMGGSDAQSYMWFEELCIKVFLAVREHSEHLVHMVVAMLESGLPCFKPLTVQNFKDRFVLDKSEREAADFMRELIRKSFLSIATKGYDHFQLLTNGIPY